MLRDEGARGRRVSMGPLGEEVASQCASKARERRTFGERYTSQRLMQMFRFVCRAGADIPKRRDRVVCTFAVAVIKDTL